MIPIEDIHRPLPSLRPSLASTAAVSADGREQASEHSSCAACATATAASTAGESVLLSHRGRERRRVGPRGRLGERARSAAPSGRRARAGRNFHAVWEGRSGCLSAAVTHMPRSYLHRDRHDFPKRTREDKHRLAPSFSQSGRTPARRSLARSRVKQAANGGTAAADLLATTAAAETACPEIGLRANRRGDGRREQRRGAGYTRRGGKAYAYVAQSSKQLGCLRPSFLAGKGLARPSGSVQISTCRVRTYIHERTERQLRKAAAAAATASLRCPRLRMRLASSLGSPPPLNCGRAQNWPTDRLSLSFGFERASEVLAAYVSSCPPPARPPASTSQLASCVRKC